MDDTSLNQRLSRISTIWTLVGQAHADPSDREATARQALLERYQKAVYRYILGAVRDPDMADDLFQDFALRFVRGDFRRADPARGRFRDFLKRALRNLITDERKRRQRHQRQVPLENPEIVAAVGEPDDPDQPFLENWRKALLDRAWEALAAVEQPAGPPFFAVLRYSYEHPKVPSAQMAEDLTNRLKPAKPFTDAGIRKTLQRARDKFADFLVDEVAQSLQTPTPEELEQELGDLGFLVYCRRALERRRVQR